MGPYVVAATPQPGYRLNLTFDNGEVRVFDATPLLDCGVFRKLSDGRFAAVRVVGGAVEWPGEIDLSWDTLYLRSVPAGEAQAEAPSGAR